MNARQLEVFRAIMRHQTLTAAANALGVSQPAVSKLLAHLETQLGYALFERIGGRLVPTAEAELLYPDADRVFRQVEALKELAETVTQRKAGLLRIGASLPIAGALLPQALAAFRRDHGEVKLHLHALPKHDLAEALATGAVDLALTLSAILAPSVRGTALADIPVVAVLPADDPLAAKAALGPADLADRPLISYGGEAEAGRLLDAAFVDEGLRRDVSIRIASSPSALPMVRAGLGLALVDGLAGLDAGSGLAIRPFLPRVAMPLTLSVDEARPPSRFRAPFLQALRTALASNMPRLERQTL